MQKIFFIMMATLLAIAGKEASAQHPLGEGQLLIGNGYFAPANKSGDGTYRYLETRWLPIKNQTDNAKFGFYLSGIEVGSKISGFKHHSTEIGLGLAANFSLQPGYQTDRYAWLNLAYKVINSTGSLTKTDGRYENRQEDQMLFLGGGLLFRNIFLEGPFAQQKIMLESQFSIKSEENSRWNGDTLAGLPWSRERVKLQAENGITPLYLGWSRNVYLMPSILAAYTYEKGSQTSFYTIGLSLTLAKGQYGYEILTLSYEPKFSAKGPRMDVFQVNLNIINL
ncbi:MAG TPA: hypothetical protein PLA05_00595 [bacterium]|jgi:hypothetical protein|nr:hypothetical protein [bacterium]HOD87115.1 hypothetical protein [bacterium]HPW05452.1 hypothetical protein [bacterium]HQB76636.1 hypothetical protein [bacterium]HQL34643.1 hypothetical protein [bacterium]